MLPELRTERLVMREVRLEDGLALQTLQNRPEQWRYQAAEPEELADGTLRVQRYFQHRGPDSNQRLFVYVAHNRQGVLIGQVSLSRFFHPAQACIGFGLATEYWGQDYATEMAARLVGFGFDQISCTALAPMSQIENKPCQRALEKIGMTYEGTARDCIWAQGRWWTEAKYAILESEYADKRKMPAYGTLQD